MVALNWVNSELFLLQRGKFAVAKHPVVVLVDYGLKIQIGFGMKGAQVRMMSDSRSGRIIPTMKLKVASRNVRTCKADSTQMLLDNEMKKYGLNICCLPETRLNDILMKSIEPTDSETFKFYNSGPTDGRGFHGVGFLNSIDASSVLSWQPVPARISALRLKGSISNVIILPVYAPIRDSPDDAKDAFYFELLDCVNGLDILFNSGQASIEVMPRGCADFGTSQHSFEVEVTVESTFTKENIKCIASTSQ
ncbi:hypothetical protein QYM36_004384 [Artemia franciscana]|uniref:Uncharacterized protein n=1 Tax=Artemia franciscana TaxID=6661 RepID=A0AA88LGA4_ARTSF|nr:hypothetical protein QYM36_004384 [Artemia franciscana]